MVGREYWWVLFNWYCLWQDQSWSKWVLCKVYEKIRSQQGVNCYSDDDDSGSELSWLDEVYLSLDDDLEEIGMPI